MNIPFKPSNVLIPKNGFEKWSVVACDQYTSDADYWARVEATVGEANSTLRITLPEIYLEDGDVTERINTINQTMNRYIENNVFNEVSDSYIYIERTVSNGKIRKGLIGAFDLEAYDFNKGSSSQIRATEGTVLERIPPRVKIRENAPLELPHIMILIDDRNNTVIESVLSAKKESNKLYDFDLMENGGHISGYKVCGDDAKSLNSALETLYNEKDFDEKYNVTDKPLLVFAVGDGNHSLATAKTCWENLKKTLSPEEQLNHPARYALAELVNVHDDSLEFEPIHRLVFDVDTKKFENELKNFFADSEIEETTDINKNSFTVIIGNNSKNYVLNKPKFNLTVGDIQSFIDHYIKNVENRSKVDYIHGEETVYNKAKEENTVGILLPAMAKNDLFRTVIVDGVLPRKTFSMGHAHEKRFYLECRKIK
ncbi:MAG: DUF1015 domain-containing protein [Clostridia bacterium]|nr:DUF1015 domain-containing protein [Clostridia bacterium]